ncbi:hypothetical protein D3C81_1971700 [compost metagenome]
MLTGSAALAGGRAGGFRRVALLALAFGGSLRGGLRLAEQQLRDQLAIMARHLQLRILAQRLLVGIQRAFQLAAAGQGVAAVVVGGGV